MWQSILGGLIGAAAITLQNWRQARDRDAHEHRVTLRTAYADFFGTFSTMLDKLHLLVVLERKFLATAARAISAASAAGVRPEDSAFTPSLQVAGVDLRAEIDRVTSELYKLDSTLGTKTALLLLLEDSIGRREQVLAVAAAVPPPPRDSADIARLHGDIDKARNLMLQVISGFEGTFAPETARRWFAKILGRKPRATAPQLPGGRERGSGTQT